LQLNVTVNAPSKINVPPLALKVGEPEIVKAPAKVIVPDGAVKVPPLMLKPTLRSEPEGNDKLPELRTTLLAAVKVV
jgi:hypothetical protein